MAILGEEEYPSSSPFAASEAQLSALEGSAYAPATVDPAAGADEEAPLTSADVAYARAPFQRTTARSPRLQARVDEISQLMEARRAGVGGDEITRMRAIANDPQAMQQFIAEAQQPLEMEPPPPPPKEEGAGWGQIFARGLLRANEAVAQGKDIAEGKQPRESKTPRADYEDPLKLEDFASPVTAAKKLWLGLAQSYPAVAAGIAGSMAGGAAGAAITGPAAPIGGTVGAIAGGALGMGISSGLMGIGPAYLSELQALGENPSPEAIDQAWEKAKVTAFKEAGVGAASMALFGAGKPASNALKALLTPVVAGAERPVAGIPLRTTVQAVGQPAISVGGQAAENVIEGKPLSTNLNEAAAGGIANVLPDVAAAMGGRALRRVVGGRRGEATPGVSDDQAAALAATQGGQPPPDRGPGPIPPPTTPTPPGMPPPRDNVPPFPDNLAPMRDNLPPPQDNLPPPRDNLPPPPTQTPAGAGPIPLADTMGLETDLSRPPRPPPMTETSAPPPPDTGPPRAPPPTGEVILPPESGPAMGAFQQPRRPPEPPIEPPPPPPPPPPSPPPPEPPGLSRLQRAAGMAEETPVVPTASEPLGPRSRLQERYGTEGVGERTVEPTHVEPDDVNIGQSVAKNAGGEVIGKGASPEEALADARARRGEPYAEEVPVEQAKPAESGTKGQLVSERAPPAEATQPEPAAQGGGNAVPREPPVAETPGATKGEQRKAAAAAKRAEKQAAAQTKLDEVKAKAAEKLHTETGFAKTETVTEEGTRTKSGAYVSPGEAVEVQAPRPAARTQSDLQREVAADAAAARSKGLVSEATRRMAEAPTPAERFHVPENLNTVRKAQLIVKHILGGMPIDEAIRAFGQKAPGTVGRPRKVESLSSHIRGFLKEAETGAAEQSRQRAMDAATARLRKLGPRGDPEVRQEVLDTLNEHLERLEKVRAQRAALEESLSAVEAAERGDKITGPKSMRGRLAEMGREAKRRAVTYFASRPEVNEPITRAVEQAGEHGARLHDLLDTLSAHTIADRLTPQMTELARVLRRVLPNVEVHDAAGSLEPRVVGIYEPRQDRIYLDLDHPSTAVNLLHEGVHTGTFDYINRLYQTPEINLSPRELAHKTALNAIRNEVGRILDEGRMSPAEYGELRYALHEDVDPSLNMAGPHELATQLLTTPEVYNILSRETASPELRAALDRVGMGIAAKATIWDGFKKIIRNIFGVPDRLDSVFDHVLRPLTEIVEEGSRFRRASDVAARQESIRHNNEILGPAKLSDNASLQRLGRAARDIADRGVVKTVMRGAYQSATTTAIRDFIKNDVPSAVSHLEQLRRITHASEQERVRQVTTHGPNGEERAEPNIDKAKRLHKELTEGPDAAAVNKLMTDVTQAEMSVIDPRRNDHLTTQEQLDVQRDLQARFDALDPAARQTYREVNEYHNEIYRAEREAKVKSLVDLAFADRPETEKQALREQMRTRQGVLDVLNNPDALPLARVLGQAWENKKGLVRLIAESQEGGFIDGDYFPSRRHGEYIVSAGEHNKPGYMVQMFDTQSAARAFRDDLMRTRQDVSQVFVKSQSRPRDLVSVAALSTLDRAMERAGLTGDAAEVMRDMYAGVMIQQGTRLAARTMRREGIAGASVDQARNILGDFLAYTSRIGHLMHGAEAGRTLYEAEKEARALHQAGSGASEQRVANAQLGVEELRRRMVPADGDNSADIMGRGTRGLTTLTVLNTLLRPAHFFMQLAGTHTAATSLIAAKHGYLGSAAAVSRAFAQLSGAATGAFGRNAMAAMRQELQAANWDLATLYRERLKQTNSGIAPAHADLLIDRLNQAGLINHTWIREIQRLAGPQGFGGGKFNMISRFLDVMGAGEHALDSMMRVGTAKAAFEMEYRNNGGHLNEALDYAMQMAERSQPDYNMHNKPRIATVSGSLGRLAPFATQYRQFGLHMYGVQGNLLAEGVRGARGSAERREAYKAIAYLQASHALMWSGVGSAVFGSLPMMAGLGLYDLLNPNDPTRRAHTNQELETQSRNWVRDMTGSKTVADIFARGAPMAFGLDVHRSLQFTNLLTPPELKSFNKPDVLSFLAQAITGASGDQAAGMVDGMSRIWDGDIKAETVAKMMPRIIRDPVEAVVWGQQGLKTGKGDLTIVPAEKFSAMDLVAKAAGFIPEITSTARSVRADINLHETTRREITDSIVSRLVRAEPAERKAAMDELYRYNANAEPADRITGQQIQSRMREQARINAQPNLYGMRVPKRQIEPTTELTRYARP